MLKIDISGAIPQNLNESEVKQVLTTALSALSVEPNFLIEVMFVEEEDMRELNLRYRKVDATTDVLSFPQSLRQDNSVNILGSIVICDKIVNENEENLVDVIKHGLLHLLGYDHETDEAAWDVAANVINCKL